MLTICTVLKSGGDFKPEQLIPMREALKLHVTIPYRFLCLTDMDFDIEGIETRAFTTPFRGWWSKINLFDPEFMKEAAPFVFFDIDTAIVGNIDFLYGLKEFYTVEDFYKPNQLMSAVMYVPSVSKVLRRLRKVWDRFSINSKNLMEEFRGDQDFIGSVITKWFKLQEEFPNAFLTFKPDKGARYLNFVPKSAHVICFHGKPRPWLAANTFAWVKQYWREHKAPKERTFILPQPKDPSVTVSLLCPSRHRPSKLLNMVQSAIDTCGSHIEILVGVNEGDEHLEVYRKIPHIQLFVFPDSFGLCEIWNELALQSSGELLMMMNDDCLFQTHHWDMTLLEHTDSIHHRIFVAWFCDGVQNQNMACFPIVSRTWVDVTGKFVEERFSFSYCDTWIWDLGKRCKNAVYIPEVYLEHLHPNENLGIEKDDTWTRTRQGENKELRDLDRQMYMKSVGERELLAHRLISYISCHRKK